MDTPPPPPVDDRRARPGRRWTTVLLGLILLAGLAARLAHLDAASLWEDDYSNLDRARMDLVRMIQVQMWQGPADTIFDIHPPLYYAWVKAALALDESAVAARLASLVAGLLAVWGVFALGRTLWGVPSGLAATALMAFSAMPVQLSRVIKPYALFLAFATWSLHFLLKALETGKPRHFAAFALLGLATCYTGYQGVLVVAAGLLYGAWVLAPWRRPDGRGRFKALAAAGAGVALGYLPWVPAVVFVNEFLRMPGVDPLAGLDATFALRILDGFVGYDFGAPPGSVPVWGAMVLAGAVFCLWRRQWGALGLLALVAAVNCAALLTSQSRLRALLETRHFVAVYLGWVLLAARGAAGLGELAARLVPRAGPWSGWLATAAAVLLLVKPGVDLLPRVYEWNLNRNRDFFHWLATRKDDVQALDFSGYKAGMMRFAARWYLPGLFEEAGTWAEPGYRRLRLVEVGSPDRIGPPPAGAVVEGTWFEAPHVWRISDLGLANRSPLSMVPDRDGRYRFTEDFRTRSYFETCHVSENMALDTLLGQLRPSGYGHPARALYVFEVPPGRSLARATLRLDAALYKRHPTRPADSVLTVRAGPDPSALKTVAVLDQSRFGGQEPCAFFDEIPFYDGLCRKAEAVLDLDGTLAASGRLCLEIAYRPGVTEGFLALTGLDLAAELAGDGPPVSLVERRAATLTRNAGAVRWVAGETVLGRSVHAFAAPGFERLARGPVGSPGDLERYRAAHPGQAPVSVLRDAEGREALFLFDPGLGRPGLALEPGRPLRLVPGTGAAGPVRALRLTGRLDAPSLNLGGRTVDIPVATPPGSVLTVAGNGRARLTFFPDWASAPAEDLGLFYADNARASRDPSGDGIMSAARGDRAAFSYAFVSGLPMTEARIAVLPEVYGNPCAACGLNRASVKVSTDAGKTYKEVLAMEGDEPCRRSARNTTLYRRLPFDGPVNSLVVLFELRGQPLEVRWHSQTDPFHRPFVEIDLDASSLSPLPELPPAGEDAVLSGPTPLRLNLYAAPLPLSRRTAPAW